jgi:hypothetical protein
MVFNRILSTVLALLLFGGAPSQPPTRTPALLLFGREDHKTFLGCLNCGAISAESVCNPFADYGSRFSDSSIWNQFNEYGSRFSDYSPWNPFASKPPVIVDGDGNFYGYFTANRTHDKRTSIPGLLSLLDNVDWVVADLSRARDAFCGE